MCDVCVWCGAACEQLESVSCAHTKRTELCLARASLDGSRLCAERKHVFFRLFGSALVSGNCKLSGSHESRVTVRVFRTLLAGRQLQSTRYSLPGTAVLQALQTTACQEHWEVAIMPALPGLGSLSGQRAAPEASCGAPGFGRWRCPGPRGASGPSTHHSSPDSARSAVLNASSKVLNTERYSIRHRVCGDPEPAQNTSTENCH